ncbi:MAG: transcriptional regulator [Candidatus Omnitrophota bacterium]
MNIKPIKTKADYKAALAEAKRLANAQPNTPKGDKLEVLSTLIEDYERKNHPIEEPDPIAAIEHRMEALGMIRKDLEPILGTRARVSEILTRKRPLTLSMIRKIHQTLQIPAETLIQTYRLNEE